jgi:hypothetical protein
MQTRRKLFWQGFEHGVAVLLLFVGITLGVMSQSPRVEAQKGRCLPADCRTTSFDCVWGVGCSAPTPYRIYEFGWCSDGPVGPGVWCTYSYCSWVCGG